MKSKLLDHTLFQAPWLRYLVVGGVSFTFEYSVFALLFLFTHALFFANSISFLVGLSISFTLHKLWSFAGGHYVRTTHQLALYSSLALINILLTNIAIGVLVNKLGLRPFVAKIVVMALVVIWNYLILNKVIFRPKTDIA